MSDILETYIGQSEHNLTELFNLMRTRVLTVAL